MHPLGRHTIHGSPVLAVFILRFEQQSRGSSNDGDGTRPLERFVSSREQRLPRQETDDQNVG